MVQNIEKIIGFVAESSRGRISEGVLGKLVKRTETDLSKLECSGKIITYENSRYAVVDAYGINHILGSKGRGNYRLGQDLKTRELAVFEHISDNNWGYKRVA